jgi:ribonuclease HI
LNFVLKKYFSEYDFGNLVATTSPFESKKQYELFHSTQISEPHYRLLELDKDDLGLDANRWKLYFDGYKSQEGAIFGCILVNLTNKKILISYRLELECTNKADEYGALVQGLRKAINVNHKYINSFGDFEIMVRQIRNYIRCLSPHLKNYQHEVWSLINNFKSFNMVSIPWILNSKEDGLANVASHLAHVDDFINNKCYIESIYRPSVSYNVTNLGSSMMKRKLLIS